MIIKWIGKPKRLKTLFLCAHERHDSLLSMRCARGWYALASSRLMLYFSYGLHFGLCIERVRGLVRFVSGGRIFFLVPILLLVFQPGILLELVFLCLHLRIIPLRIWDIFLDVDGIVIGLRTEYSQLNYSNRAAAVASRRIRCGTSRILFIPRIDCDAADRDWNRIENARLGARKHHQNQTVGKTTSPEGEKPSRKQANNI